MNSLQRIISLPQKGGPNGTVPDEISTSLATRLTAVIQLKSNDRRKINNSVAFRYLCFVFLISRHICVHVWLMKLSCFLVSGVSLGFY